MTRVRRMLLLSVLATSVPVSAAGQTWLEVRSPHFTVLSDASEGRARNVAWQFEQIRGAIQSGWPWARVELSRPVLVVAARNEASTRALTPEYWEKGRRGISSVMITMPDRYLVIVDADSKVSAPDFSPYFTAYEAYARLAIGSAFKDKLPLWFEIGFAEAVGNTIVTDSEIRFGLPIVSHILGATTGPTRRLAELVAMTPQSPYFQDSTTRGTFDKQAWLVVQYLLFGRGGAGRGDVNAVAKLILEGKSSADAITAVFGSVEALEQAVRTYYKEGPVNYGRLQVGTSSSADGYAARPASSAQVLSIRALIRRAFDKTADARVLIEQARAADSRLAVVHEADAAILRVEEKSTEADAAVARAVELKSDNFHAYLELATALWQGDMDVDRRKTIEGHLKRALELNPATARGHSLLGQILLLGDNPTAALPSAQRAVDLEPSEPTLRRTLSRVLERLSRPADALGQALAARALAKGDDDRKAAQQLIDALAPKVAPPATASPQ